MKFSYFLPPVAVGVTALAGGLFTSMGMPWYRSIALPPFTPPGYVISTVWSVLFVLSACAMILVLRNGKKEYTAFMSIVFGINLLLNMLWSVLFFGVHEIGFAFFEALLLAFSVFVLMASSWKISKAVVWLFSPYFLWVLFAAYLTYSVWELN